MARKASRKGKRRSRKSGLWTSIVQVFTGSAGAGGRKKPAKKRSTKRQKEAAHDRIQEIKGLLLIGLALWLAISMISYYRPYDDPAASGRNWGGQLGFYFAGAAFITTGLAGHFVSILSLCWGFVLVTRKEVALPALRILSALCCVCAVAFLMHLGLSEKLPASGHLPYGPGGWLAIQATPFLGTKFGGAGLWILVVLTALISFMLATEMAFFPSLVAFREWAREQTSQRDGSVLRAMGEWTRNLFLGLWDFLRGAGLGETAEARGGASKKKAAKKKKASKPKVVLEDEADDEYEEEGEYEDDEYEYEDEDAEGEYEDEDEEEYDEEEEGEGDDEEYDEEEEDEYEYEDEEEEPEIEVKPAAKKKAAKKAAKPVPVAVAADLPFDPPTPPPGDWKLPPANTLESPDRARGIDDAALEKSALKLEQALRSFRVDASVVGAQVGPTVILFELEVSQGTRMNKVTQLSQEIAAALRAQSVRIIAPIPGKATVGIEVPNLKRRKVRISELVSEKAYDKKHAALPLFLGMDAEGHPIVEDLTRMPHLLIAGTTGSGKSVCINTILASFLLTRSPHDVQLILIDPKMVELQVFSQIPHLMLPVVTDMRQATNVLLWTVEKMEGRYEVLKNAGVRNIKGYNALGEDELKRRLGDDWNEERTPRHLPYIVVVIDEFADLMMTSKKEAEQAITRLAQKSRAVGIHVILATQRPSTDVITGVIKGNLPTRIAFQVASKVDSRVILDAMGADKLLGGGDMLYNPPQSSRIKRVQGALVEDHELEEIVDFVCQESAPTFSQELIQAASGAPQPAAGGGFETALKDDLWDEAVRVILKSRRGSASLLQRALGIGYTRASRLLDMMSEAGIVSDHKGSKAREVLMSLEDWEEQHGAPLGQAGEGG